MWKYDGLTYPDIGEEMLKHKTLGKILRAELKASMFEENYLFLDALRNGTRLHDIYDTYLASGSPQEINISSATMGPMRAAAEMGDFSSPIWIKKLKTARSEINLLIKANLEPRDLTKNTAFKAYHKSRKWQNKGSLIKKYQLSKEVKKVAEFLNLDTSDKTYEAIAEAAAALHYEPKGAQKPITILVNASDKKLNSNSIKNAILKSFGKL